MKLNIKSKQIYETHIDEITEEYEAKINFFENGFEICYDICKGIDYTWNDNPFQLDLKYILKLGNTAEYINELQMSILDKK